MGSRSSAGNYMAFLEPSASGERTRPAHPCCNALLCIPQIATPFLQTAPNVEAQIQLTDGKRAAPPEETAHTGAKDPSRVVRDRVPAGSFFATDAALDRIAGRVKVLNAHTLVFDDGTEVELNGGIDAPGSDPMGLIGDALYPCVKDGLVVERSLSSA